MKATQMNYRVNLRRMRAERTAAAVLDALKGIIPSERDAMWRAYSALLELFMANGIEVLTDLDRQTLGLSPRGSDGWTQEEIVAHDSRLLNAMLAPMPPFVLTRNEVK